MTFCGPYLFEQKRDWPSYLHQLTFATPVHLPSEVNPRPSAQEECPSVPASLASEHIVRKTL